MSKKTQKPKRPDLRHQLAICLTLVDPDNKDTSSRKIADSSTYRQNTVRCHSDAKTFPSVNSDLNAIQKVIGDLFLPASKPNEQRPLQKDAIARLNAYIKKLRDLLPDLVLDDDVAGETEMCYCGA